MVFGSLAFLGRTLMRTQVLERTRTLFSFVAGAAIIIGSLTLNHRTVYAQDTEGEDKPTVETRSDSNRVKTYGDARIGFFGGDFLVGASVTTPLVTEILPENDRLQLLSQTIVDFVVRQTGLIDWYRLAGEQRGILSYTVLKGLRPWVGLGVGVAYEFLAVGDSVVARTGAGLTFSGNAGLAYNLGPFFTGVELGFSHNFGLSRSDSNLVLGVGLKL